MVDLGARLVVAHEELAAVEAPETEILPDFDLLHFLLLLVDC